MSFLDILLFIYIWVFIAIPIASIYIILKKRNFLKSLLTGKRNEIKLHNSFKKDVPVSANDGELLLQKELEELKNIATKSNSLTVKTEKSNNGHLLDIDKDISMFKKTFDNDYENAINISSLEISHSHQIDLKQLELQAEEKKRARLID
jgi:hypothetical protein